MAENMNVFNFSLSEDDKKEIFKLDDDGVVIANHYYEELVKYLINLK